MLRKLSLVLILLTIGSGCTDNLNIKVPPLPISERPTLEHITDQEFNWLKDKNPVLHNKIAVNDSRLKSHVKKLEGIILTTH